jgi:ubiquitin-conjugating enzyme (huntingtin interacting protein 2)
MSAQLPPTAAARVQKDIKQIREETKKGKSLGISVDLRNGNSVAQLVAVVEGPPDTPYQGGKYYINIDIPQNFPFAPPKCVFVTKVWHPNISSETGVICLDTLTSEGWTPAVQLRVLLMSIQQLLQSPRPDDPQDGVVAKQYIHDWDAWWDQARGWAVKFACADAGVSLPKKRPEGLEELVSNDPEDISSLPYAPLVEMGFSLVVAQNAFDMHGGDIEQAAEYLFTQEHE